MVGEAREREASISEALALQLSYYVTLDNYSLP